MFHELWDKAGEAPDAYKPAAGVYQAEIVDGGAFTSRAGDDYAKVNLKITQGDEVGRQFEHFMGFKHEVGARINREALSAYGLHDPAGVRTILDLDDRIQALIGTHVEVGISYKDGYMQIRVLTSQPREAPDISEQFAKASNGVPADEIPF